MTQIFNDDVKIDGVQDITQLRVEGHTTQTQPLQTWQNSAGSTLGRVTGDGRLQIGDLGLSTVDALVEASADLTLPTARPKRGLYSLGKLTGALSDAVAWAVHELKLLGTGGVTGLQTALRAILTHNNTGSGASADLRAMDAQVINQAGTGGTPIGRAAAVRGTASNATNAYLSKAVGVEATVTNDSGATLSNASAFEVAPPTNAGTLDRLYGVRVPTFSDLTGITSDYASAQFEDDVELKLQGATPGKNPPANFVKMYPKLNAGVPALYAKDATGTEYSLSGSGGALSAADSAATKLFRYFTLF